MHPLRVLLLAVNVVGGVAVLGSYALGIRAHENAGALLWGAVPESLRPVYTISMFTATAGYLAFTAYVLLLVDPGVARIGGFGYGLLIALYVLVLLPAALWMPLTFRFLDAGATSESLWLAIRAVLAATGLGALALIAALAAMSGAPAGTLRTAAFVGAIAFSLQTSLLDALVWPALFRR